jgi:hypothetical protein
MTIAGPAGGTATNTMRRKRIGRQRVAITHDEADALMGKRPAGNEA